MPSYAGKPWKNDTQEIEVFQIKNSKGQGAFYYRLNIKGQSERPSRLLANEFKYSEAHFARLKAKYPFSDPCSPPQFVKEQATRVLARAKDRISKKGEMLVATKTPTLKEAAALFLDEMSVKHEEGKIGFEKFRRYNGFVKNYVNRYEHFDKFSMDELTAEDMVDWQYWRDTFWTYGPGVRIDAIEVVRGGKVTLRKVTQNDRKPPSASTKTKEKSYINAILKWATHKDRKWVTGPLDWNAQANIDETSPANRAAWFDDFEWDDFVRKAMVWIEEQPRKHPGQKEKYYRRHFCMLFVFLMRSYGLRVGECYALDGEDVINMPENFEVSLNSMKHPISRVHERTIAPGYHQVDLSGDVIQSLKKIYLEAYGIKMSPDQPLWMQSDGSRVKSFYRPFETLLANTGYLYDEHGNKRNLKSIRHTTLTYEIMHSNYKVKTIASWAGTSENVLRNTYSKAFRHREGRRAAPSAFA